jgi:hypothetical protein
MSKEVLVKKRSFEGKKRKETHLARLDVFIVKGNNQALSSLAGNNSRRLLSSVDGAIISLEGSVLDTSHVEAGHLERAWVSEALDELQSLICGNVEASRGRPDCTVVSEKSTLGDTASSDEGVINIRLPRHGDFCVVVFSLARETRTPKDRREMRGRDAGKDTNATSSAG